MSIAPSAYQGRLVIPTGHPSRVDAWGGAWEAVEDVPLRPCIWLTKGYPFRGFKVLRHGPGPIPAPPATLFRVGSGTPPGMCALIWEMGGGAPLAPYPMASCARSPFRARLDAGIPGVRRGGDWWWCRHMEAWAPMGAGAWIGRAGVVCGVDPYRNSVCHPALRLGSRRSHS